MIRRLALTIGIAALILAPAAFGQSATGTSTLSTTVVAEATISITTGTTTLSNTGTVFNAFTGTTNFTYSIRTTVTGGTGSITVSVAAFDTGGPVLTDLTYISTIAAPGTGAGPLTANTTATSVATFSTDAHASGLAGSMAWTLVDNPAVKTGAHNAVATFTISAS